MKRAFEETTQEPSDPVLALDLLARLLWYTPKLARTCKYLAVRFRDGSLITHYRQRANVVMWLRETNDVYHPVDWNWYLNNADIDQWLISYRITGGTSVYTSDDGPGAGRTLDRMDTRFSIRSIVKIPRYKSTTLAGLLSEMGEDTQNDFNVKVRIDDPDGGEPMIAIKIRVCDGDILDTAMTIHDNSSVGFDYVQNYARFLAAHPRDLVNFATCGVIFPNSAITPLEFPLMDSPRSVKFFHGML